MEKKEYSRLVKKNSTKEHVLKNCLTSFLVGGIVGVIGEFLVNFYSIFNITKNEATTWMLITLIFFACLFTALGFFDDLVTKFRCGLIIPITGFAHSVMSCMLDYKKDGLVCGVGSNTFKLAGSVLLYGMVAGFLLALIKVLIYG